MKLLLALLTVVSLAACKKDPPATTPPDNSGGSSEQPANDATACTAHEDCVVIETECCDACNGGEAVAVNADHADEVETAQARGECERIACTLLGCASWIPTCEAGHCTLVRGEL